MRVTIDLMKKSTQIIDLSDVINPRVGDDDLLLPLHIVYGDNQTDMRGKDVEFISEDTNKQRIYVGGTCNTNTPGDNLYMGNLTFRFPAGTFKADGTYDPDKTMFRIVDKETQKVISSVNVKITVMKNAIEFDFDPDNSSYDSRLETMLHDFHDKGQTMLDEIKDLKNQANSNVSGDTAATAQEAKKQADTNAGDISDLKGEVAGARGRFTNMADREDAQDAAINQKETIVNANANYAALQQKDAQQDAAIADKAGKFELENKLAQIDLQPEILENEAVLKTKYPSGKVGLIVTADTWHKYVWVNNSWQDCGELTDNAFKAARDASQDVMFGQDIRNWEKGGTIVEATEEFSKYQDKPIVHLKSISSEDYTYVQSGWFSIKEPTISIQFPEMVKDLSAQGIAKMEIHQLKATEGQNDSATWNANTKWIVFDSEQNSNMKLFKLEDLNLNPDTVKIQIRLEIQGGTGSAYIGTPLINVGSRCIAYSPLELAQSLNDSQTISFEQAQNASQNLLYGQSIRDWNKNIGGKYEVSTDASVQFENSPIIHVSGTTKDVWNHWISPTIPVTSLTLSLQLPEMASGVYGSSASYIVIVPLAAGEKYGDSSTNDKTITLGTSNSTMGLAKFENINLPSGTVSVVLDIIQQGIGDFYFGNPCLNYGDICIPYTPVEITRSLANVTKESQDKFDMLKGGMADLLFGEDVRKWTNTINGTYEIVQGEEGKFDGSPIIHMSGTTKEIFNHWISPVIPVTSLTLSLQLPEKSSGVYGSSASYIGVVPLAEGEKYGDSSTASKVLIYGIGNGKMGLSKIENIKLPADTVSVIIDITQQGICDLYFGKPVLNYGDTCVAYNQALLAEQQSESSAYIPQLYICSTSSAFNYSSAPVAFRFVRPSGTVKGYLNFDVQGDTSREYTKKNLKLKLFKDSKGKEKLKIKALSSWPKTNKYNLKANWIDATQARNIVNARLIKDAVAMTPLEKPAQTGSILSTEGLGQVDGFPIEVYFYDGYHGLYTMNTKKEEKTFNMDNKNPADEVLSNELSAEDFTNSKYTVDGKNWVSEIHDQPSETLKTNLKKFQDFVNTATDEDFKAHIQDYIDVKSVITHILFGQLAHEIDYDTKSQLLATWNDGAYWYLIPYDLDSTWGLYWDGRTVNLDDDAFSLTKAISDPSKATKIIKDGNKLHERIFKLFKPEFKAQGQKLRATVWSTPNLISKFKDFIDGVPEQAYKKDEEFWSDQPGKVWWGTDETHYTGIPSLEITSFTQLQQAIIKRGQEFDNFLAQLA